jgi:hypothetical protein
MVWGHTRQVIFPKNRQTFLLTVMSIVSFHKRYTFLIVIKCVYLYQYKTVGIKREGNFIFCEDEFEKREGIFYMKRKFLKKNKVTKTSFKKSVTPNLLIYKANF